MTVAKNGKLIRTATMDTAVEPLCEKKYELPFEKESRPGEYTITVSFHLKEQTIWAEAGHEIAFGQYVYNVDGVKEICTDEIQVIHSTHNIGVRGAHFEVLFSVLNGGLVSYKYAGREMIEAIPKPNFWRAPTDNDCGNQMPMRYAQWKIASMYLGHKEYRKGEHGPMNLPEVGRRKKYNKDFFILILCRQLRQANADFPMKYLQMEESKQRYLTIRWKVLEICLNSESFLN